MDWKLLTRADYAASGWSGGTTTQLAIAPEGADYAGRNFLWRLSSATVELDHSTFTPLPDYNRFLSVLEGEIRLRVDGGAPAPLVPGQVIAFDGGVPVESWGQCVDFNLMVRKGKAAGEVTALYRDAPFEELWNPGGKTRELAVYCVSGNVRLPEFGLEAKAGQFLLCRNAQAGPVRLAGGAGAVMLAAVKEA